jgi:hypothetical protein
MINTIDEYLDALKEEMKGSDPALIQDALADAREHLSTALAETRGSNPDLNESETLQKLIEEYGTPEETASAYREVERRTSPALKKAAKPRSGLGLFFGIYDDPRAWGTLLYMVISLLTGILYFTWVVTGLALSVSLSIFIFGLPLAILFLLSVRALALLEGRLVEALLGERMPRRPLFSHQGIKLLERLKMLVSDKHTWLSMLYMLLQLVFGIIYFTLVITVFSVSLSFMALPILQGIFKDGLIVLGNARYFFPIWSYPFLILFGFLLWTVWMHIAWFIGQLHGRFAKWMLVTE